MAAQTIDQAGVADGEQDQDGQARNRAGRVLDIAGICAGVVLGVILFDIVSGGKLTRWARARTSPGPGPDGKPDCGCGGDGVPDDN